MKTMLKMLLQLFLFTTLCYEFGAESTKDRYLPVGWRIAHRLSSNFWNHRWNIYAHLVSNYGDVFPDQITDAFKQEDETDYEFCSLCKGFVGLAMNLLDAGLSEEELLSIGVQICYNVTAYDGALICEGIVNIQGPHLLYVLNTTSLSTAEVCQFFKQCPSKNHKEINYEQVYRRRARFDPSPIKKKEDLFTIIQTTDIHIDPKYAAGTPTDCSISVCCRNYSIGQGEAGEWGDYSCELPIKTLEKMLESMIKFQADMLVYSGDSAVSALWEETVEGQVEHTEIIASLIGQYLPDTLVHYAEGNHDIFPTNLHYAYRPEIQMIQERLAEMWAPLANFSSEQIETMKLGAYYTQVVHPGLRVISYNSNYGYTANFYGPLLPDSQYWLDMIDFLETSFNLARSNGEMVLLITHHPPIPESFDFYIETIYDIINRNGDLIIIQLTGHHHQDRIMMFVDESFNTSCVTLSSGTGTPDGTRNPMYKVLYLDLDTMVIQDAEVYYLDLKNLTESGGEPEFQLMYSYQNDYGMADLSPQAFQEFTNRMVYNPQLFDLYQYNERLRATEPGTCDDDCRYRAICTIRSPTLELYQQCISLMPFP